MKTWARGSNRWKKNDETWGPTEVRDDARDDQKLQVISVAIGVSTVHMFSKFAFNTRYFSAHLDRKPKDD